MFKYFVMFMWYKVLYLLIACGGVMLAIWVVRFMGFGSVDTSWVGLVVGLAWGLSLLYFKVPDKLNKKADKYLPSYSKLGDGNAEN